MDSKRQLRHDVIKVIKVREDTGGEGGNEDKVWKGKGKLKNK